jgi:hypothetical protein
MVSNTVTWQSSQKYTRVLLKLTTHNVSHITRSKHTKQYVVNKLNQNLTGNGVSYNAHLSIWMSNCQLLVDDI